MDVECKLERNVIPLVHVVYMLERPVGSYGWKLGRTFDT